MFKCYRQIQRSDCGLACVRMIAKHYGKEISSHYLQGLSDLSRLGMTVNDVAGCFSSIGMQSVAARIKLEDANRMPLRAVLHWDNNHFVVLYNIKSKRRRFCIADPSYGKVTYDESQFLNHWRKKNEDYGLAILIDPSEEFYDKVFPKDNSIRKFFSHIYKFVTSHRRSFLICLFISLFLMIFDISLPMMMQRTVDDGILLKDMGLVMMLLLFQLSVAVGIFISSNITEYLMTRIGLSVNLAMISDFLEKLTKFPISYFDSRASSDFVQNISDQTRIKDFLVDFPNTVVLTSLNLIVFSCLLIYYSPIVFGLFFILSIIEISWTFLFLNRRKVLDLELFNHSSESRNHAYELANGMLDLRSANGETIRIRKWEKTQRSLNKISRNLSKLKLIQQSGKNSISKLKDLTVMGIGAYMVINGQLTIGILVTLGYITGRLSVPFENIASQISEMQVAILSYKRVEEVSDFDKEKHNGVKANNSSVEFNNVFFKYPGSTSPDVIRNLTLQIEPGSTIALVGESGCGKSTLIKLMLGFYQPRAGEILLGEISLSKLDTQDWIRHCGVVLQNGQIFSGTIKENIALSDEQPDIKKVKDLLEIVGLNSFVGKLPMGINTEIGVWGVEMSGGQKQRLMIARALYKQPDILFLDEATSSLDANNEKSIVEKLRDYGKGRTIVIAAHRLSTIRHADKIVFMREGRIIEEGTHEELIALGGEYRRLFQNQIESGV